MTGTTAVPGRFHAFDSLRASMMLLGLVLHGAIGYVTFPTLDGWAFKDPATTALADILVIGIHVFRMPLFFVMAGFFAALLVERRGVTGMVRNRLARVTLVFLVAWPLISPLTSLAAYFAIAQVPGATSPVAAGGGGGWGALWNDHTMHLWFLWYLTAFYLTVLILHPILHRVPAGLRAALSERTAVVLASPLRVLALVPPTALILWWQGGLLQTGFSFRPNILILAGYAIFFSLGWTLWHHQLVIGTLQRFAWTQVALGLLIMPVTVIAQSKLTVSGSDVRAVAAVSGAIVVWLLIFGISGLAIRFASHERPVMRYLTDASYWMYLIHIPLMFFANGLMAPLGIPAVVKMLIAMISVTIVTAVTYHFLVRNTPIGVFLNGRRYPRTFPGNAPAPSLAAAEVASS